MSLTEGLLIALLVILLVAAILLVLWISSSRGARDIIALFFRNLRKKRQKTDYRSFVDNLSSALLKLGTDSIGAIVAVERSDSLEMYVGVGHRVDSDFSAEFIISVFYNKRSALHDGAIIVRNKRIASISSYFPMTRQLLDISYGARHRSAVGLSERTDAVVFVVSETNGRISAAKNGRIRRLSTNPDRLTDEINSLLTGEETV